MSEGARESISGTNVDNTPPPPEPTTELPVQSWNQFIQPLDPTNESRKGLDLRDSLTDNALDLEGAAEEVKRRRWETGEPVGGPQDAVRTNEPIFEHKVQGNRPYRDVREATDDLAFSRMRAAREELRGQGWNDDQLYGLAHLASTRQVSLVDEKTGLPIEGPDPQPAQARLADQYGNPLSELGDRVTPDDALNPRKAAELLGNWRQAEAQRQAEELAQLQGEQQQQATEYQAEQYQEPEPQAEPQERTVQAFSQEHADRAALAQERQYVAQIGNMSLAEAGALSDLTRLGEWANANIPEIPALQQLAQTNPAQYQAELQRLSVQQPQKFAALGQVDQLARQHQARLAHASQQRQLIQAQYEQQSRQANMATLRAYRDAQDSAFDKVAAEITPQWQDPNVRREIRDGVSKLLKDAGMTKTQMDALWSGDQTVDLHHVGAQTALLKAVLYDRAVASMRNLNSQRAPVPPVQRPGTYRPAGAADADRLNDLNSQLGRARGTQEQLRIAAKISRTKRGMETY